MVGQALDSFSSVFWGKASVSIGLKRVCELGKVANACHPSTVQAEAGELQNLNLAIAIICF